MQTQGRPFMPWCVTVAVMFFSQVLLSSAVGAPSQAANPDFTQGDRVPEGANHDWNLGATGARGWMFCDRLVTTDARQIYVTQVQKHSPADGILAIGDVILGVAGKPFSYDPRTELGRALTTAESEAGGGNLSLIRWRAGTNEHVIVKLPVLGTYSATAYECPKSQRIIEQGCEAFSTGSFQTWYYGYVMMLLSEYAMATGDESHADGAPTARVAGSREPDMVRS
jgi:hypothetical protein